VWYVQMSPDVVLECQECGWGLVDSCMTTGHWFYSYSPTSGNLKQTHLGSPPHLVF